MPLLVPEQLQWLFVLKLGAATLLNVVVLVPPWHSTPTLSCNTTLVIVAPPGKAAVKLKPVVPEQPLYIEPPPQLDVILNNIPVLLMSYTTDCAVIF